MDYKYLSLLGEKYRDAGAAASEIAGLEAILSLPKGTEHFVSDIHGEYAPLYHILRNASGVIRHKIDLIYGDTMSEAARRTLATLIYYPEEKLRLIKQNEPDTDAFYEETLKQLCGLLGFIAVKYTRSYVREQIPGEYAYIIEELLYGDTDARGSSSYRDKLIRIIIDIGSAEDFIIAMSDLISRLSIYKLHVLGDLFDRGPGADRVVDILIGYHSVDIEWGNHDILWMGAACGNKACVAGVIRNCTKYDNLRTLEVGYGISLRPLITFALSTYGDDPCECFRPSVSAESAVTSSDYEALSRINKAISIIQFKLEGQLIAAHECYGMESMRLLDKIDYASGTVRIDGKIYPMRECRFPTVDPADPYRLTPEEEAVIDCLRNEFLESPRLREHLDFLIHRGSMYKVFNGNLLFHGCMPLTDDGHFAPIHVHIGTDSVKSGKAWFDYADEVVRNGYLASLNREIDGNPDIDFYWYLWCGYESPLFGKKKITTFERIYIEDESTWVEAKNPYYELMDRVEIVDYILREFGLDPASSHIINGHMPVKRGSNPLHAGGKAIVIDGGFAKAYQKTTGIAGYTLIFDSHGLELAAHEPFRSREEAVREELDIHSQIVAAEDMRERIYNRDTDDCAVLVERVRDLRELLTAYRHGSLPEKHD